MNLLNLILFTTMPPTLQAVNLPATAMLGIVMSSRLVLNIRAPLPAPRPSMFKTTEIHSGVPPPTAFTSSTIVSYQTHNFSEDHGILSLTQSQDVEIGASPIPTPSGETCLNEELKSTAL